MTDYEAFAAEIAASGLFDAEWYAAEYPDVVQSGLDPLLHFARIGLLLKRNPGPDFDARFYLERYVDVARGQHHAFIHYIRYGREEGRLPLRPRKVEMVATEQLHPASAPADAAWDYRQAFDAFARRGLERLSPVAVLAVTDGEAGWRSVLGAVDLLAMEHDLYVSGPEPRDFSAVPGLVRSITWLSQESAPGDAINFAGNGGLDGYEAALIMQTARAGEQEIEAAVRLATAFRADADWGCLASAVGHEDLGDDTATRADLTMAGLVVPRGAVPVPRGAVLWIKPLLARVWRQADGPDVFGDEAAGASWQGALRRLAVAAALADMDVRVDPKAPVPDAAEGQALKAVAFYLPQFHPIPENDRWWGKGFTEWFNVVRGRPFFDGHDQPRLPADHGFYDLRSIETQRAQAALAKQFGIYGFCYHYYWFNGRKLLDRPLEQFLSSDIDHGFCLCWANENWSRNWDGLHLDVLLEQTYSLESNVALIREWIPMMRDPRWIRYQGKPVVLVYRIGLIPDWIVTARLWREECHRAGIGDIHLCAVRFALEQMDGQPQDHGLDSYVIFPPHEMAGLDVRDAVSRLDPAFEGEVLSYEAAVDADLGRFALGYPWPVHRGVMASWDNTARRGARARIYHGASPFGFRRWVKGILGQEEKRGGDETLLFLNAWNEWAEGSYLEPDQRWGASYLEGYCSAVQAVPTMRLPDRTAPTLDRIGFPLDRTGAMRPAPRLLSGRRAVNPDWPTVMLCAHISGHQLFGGERSLLDVLEALATMAVNVVVTLPSDNHPDYVARVSDLCTALYCFAYPQWADRREAYAWLTLDFAEIIARHDVVLVHANTIVLLEPLAAARLMGRMAVVHARELVTLDDALCRQIGLSPGEIVSTVAKRADWVIGNSRATCALYGGGRVLYVPNAVSAADLDIANPVGRLVRVGIVSSNVASKGIADFVEVARRAAARGINAVFVIVGPRTEDIDRWIEEAAQGARPANLEFAGYKDQPGEAMRGINILLNLSLFGESFGRTVAEAMAAARPVVAYHWGALPELVDDGETGFLVPYRDLDAVVEALETLCADPARIAAMGEKGRAKVTAQFSQDRLRVAVAEAYATMLAPTASKDAAGQAPRVRILLAADGVPADRLRACLDTLIRNTDPRQADILVATGDHDDDRRALLDSYRTHTGLGVQEAGEGLEPLLRAMEEGGPADVVILDGREQVKPRWLEGLRAVAYGRAQTGMVLPLGHAVGSGPTLRDADALLLLQRTIRCAPLQVRRAAGCAYLKRSALATIDWRACLSDGWSAAAGERLRKGLLEKGWETWLSPWSIVVPDERGGQITVEDVEADRWADLVATLEARQP